MLDENYENLDPKSRLMVQMGLAPHGKYLGLEHWDAPELKCVLFMFAFGLRLYKREGVRVRSEFEIKNFGVKGDFGDVGWSALSNYPECKLYMSVTVSLNLVAWATVSIDWTLRDVSFGAGMVCTYATIRCISRRSPRKAARSLATSLRLPIPNINSRLNSANALDSSWLIQWRAAMLICLSKHNRIPHFRQRPWSSSCSLPTLWNWLSSQSSRIHETIKNLSENLDSMNQEVSQLKADATQQKTRLKNEIVRLEACLEVT